MLNIAEKHQDNRLIADAYGHLGLVALSQRDYSLARKWYTKALEVAKASNNLTSFQKVQSNLGRVIMLEGNYESAEKIFRETLELARSLHISRGVRVLLTNLVEALIRGTRYTEAENVILESEKLNIDANDAIGTAWNYKHRGQLLKARGDLEGGNSMIEKGLAILEERGEKDYVPEFKDALKDHTQLKMTF